MNRDDRDTIQVPPLDCKTCGGTGIKVSFAADNEANPVLGGTGRVGHLRACGVMPEPPPTIAMSGLGPPLRIELCDHPELEEVTQPNNERPTP